MKHKVVIDAFTGDELKQYINNLGIAKLKERDFVQGIIEYCSHPVNRVLSISGLVALQVRICCLLKGCHYRI